MAIFLFAVSHFLDDSHREQKWNSVFKLRKEAVYVDTQLLTCICQISYTLIVSSGSDKSETSK